MWTHLGLGIIVFIWQLSTNSSESESYYHSDIEDVREYSDYGREVELSSEDESTQSEAVSSAQGDSAMEPEASCVEI